MDEVSSFDGSEWRMIFGGDEEGEGEGSEEEENGVEEAEQEVVAAAGQQRTTARCQVNPQAAQQATSQRRYSLFLFCACSTLLHPENVLYLNEHFRHKTKENYLFWR